MKANQIIFGALFFLLIGCVATQNKDVMVYPLNGKWKITGIEQNKKHMQPKLDELSFVFEKNQFEIFVDNQSMSEEFGLGDISFALKKGKLFLNARGGEKFTADIEFFGPNSIRVSNFTATQKAAIVVMSFKAAATGDVFDDSTEWVKKAKVYLSKID